MEDFKFSEGFSVDSLKDEDDCPLIHINVGGTTFTTIYETVINNSAFFKNALQKVNCTSENDPKITSSSSSLCSSSDSLIRLNKRTYFVDRSPVYFGIILSFLRKGKINFPENISSKELADLQDEAEFYGLPNLIKELIAHSHIEIKRDISWMDQSGIFNGLRVIPGTRIAFAVSKDNYCRLDTKFDPPEGFYWASQADYLNEFEQSFSVLGNCDEWIHYNLGGWYEYRWKYTMNVSFIFSDSFVCGRFIHAGMKVNDVAHVALFSMHADFIEYDDQKGIMEGFAGIVLLSHKTINDLSPKKHSKTNTLSIPLTPTVAARHSSHNSHNSHNSHHSHHSHHSHNSKRLNQTITPPINNLNSEHSNPSKSSPSPESDFHSYFRNNLSPVNEGISSSPQTYINLSHSSAQQQFQGIQLPPNGYSHEIVDSHYLHVNGHNEHISNGHISNGHNIHTHNGHNSRSHIQH